MPTGDDPAAPGPCQDASVHAVDSRSTPQLQASSLNDPAVHADQAKARRLGRRYAELSPIVRTAAELEAARGNLAAARELDR